MPFQLLQHHSHQQLCVNSCRAGYSGRLQEQGLGERHVLALAAPAGFYYLLSRSGDVSALTVVCASQRIPLLCHQTPLWEGFFKWCREPGSGWFCGSDCWEQQWTALTDNNCGRSCKKLPGLCSTGSFFPPFLLRMKAEHKERSGFAVGSDHCSPLKPTKLSWFTQSVSRGAPSWWHFKAVTFKMNQCHRDGIALHQLKSTTASPGSQVLIKLFPLNCVLSGEQIFL